MKAKRQGYMLAVANPKGGVGKTTTTINLGAALAEKGRKVLLVDFDPQGHLTAGCGLKAAYAGKDFELASLILDGAIDRIKSFIVPVENFWVLPANVSLVRLEDELVVQRGGESRLRKLLGPIGTDFEFCLIDSPPTINILTDSILLAAKKVLIPVQAEDTSLRGIEALESEISELKDILDADIEIVAILPNMVARNSVCERVLTHLLGEHSMEAEQFESRWANLVTGFQIRKRVDLAKAWRESKSIFSYNPRCDAVESYRKLADLLEEKAAS
jgi:chromosome partitioning protein